MRSYLRIYLFTVAAFLLFTACAKDTETSVNSSTAKRFEFRGTVVSVDKAKKTAKIDHKAIPGHMDAMTMDFPIHENWVWNELLPGAEVTAELVVDNQAKDPYWLEKIAILARANPNEVPVNENFAQVGKDVPDFSLTNQDGKRIAIKDFRGKALAITFIYRECPLPDFCIKMSRNFSDVVKKIEANTDLKNKLRLLSISFDPARDTPEKLRQYGQGYLGNPTKPDFTVWQLAVGSDKEVRSIADFFGLQYEVDAADKTQINHSLVTAVISPEGKVTKIFKGNEWTPDDLLNELEFAGRNR